jgi:hypothetical protein
MKALLRQEFARHAPGSRNRLLEQAADCTEIVLGKGCLLVGLRVETHLPHDGIDVSPPYARRSRPHTLRHLQSRLSSGGVILSPVVARPSVSALSRTMTAPKQAIAATCSGFPVVVVHIAGLPTPLVGFVNPRGPSGRRHAGDPVADPVCQRPYVSGPKQSPVAVDQVGRAHRGSS